MKNKHLIEKALEVLSNDFINDNRKVNEAKTLINKFLASQHICQIGKFDLSKFTKQCKTEYSIRPALTGIYNDPEGYKVASDGNILCAVKADVNSENEGVFLKDGTKYEGKYANYKSVLPINLTAGGVEIIDGFKVDIFDTKKLYQIIQENKPLAKAKSKKYWRIIIEFKYNANNYIYFDGKYLELFIKFLNEFTTSAIYIIPEKNQMFAQDSVGNKCLLMSINKNGINTNHLVIKFY